MRSIRLYTTCALLLLSCAVIAQTPAISTLEVNNVRATIKGDGTLFNDGQGQFVPIEPGLAQKTLLRHSGIWIAGVDPAFNLKGAVSVNKQSDFQPGSLTNDALPFSDLNKIWKVSCGDIQQHLADFQDNGIIDNPNAAVYGFPCRDNQFFNLYNPGLALPFTSQGLAPFFDRDDDASYNPKYGDYPSIELRGCRTDLYPEEQDWLVSNDVTAHPSGLAPTQMEIQTQVLVFKTPKQSLINNAIFVRYKLINRALEPLDSCFVGMYADFDIGNPDDDFIGSIPNRQIMYGYNGDTNDEGGFGTDAPVMAMDLLRAPLDSFGEEVPLRYALTLDNVDNLKPIEYYRLLNGRQKDDSPTPNNGLMYPGNPNNPNEVSEVTLQNTPGKRVGLTSFGPFTLLPGAVNELIVAYYYVRQPGATPLQNVQALYDQSEQIQALFDNCFEGIDNSCDAKTTDAPYYVQETGLLLSPNPSDAAFTIESKGEPFNRVEVVDMLGRQVKSIELGGAIKQYQVPTDDLQSGVYQVRIGGGRVLPVVVQH